MIPCSAVYGCGDVWADGEYIIKHPIWHESRTADLCRDCFEKWCSSFPHEFDTDQ
jgi:hypothetical protein